MQFADECSGTRTPKVHCSPIYRRSQRKDQTYGKMRRLTDLELNDETGRSARFQRAELFGQAKRFLFWRDLYSVISDQQIIATLGLHANEILREIMIRYAKETRRDASHRTVRKLLAILDNLFAATSLEKETHPLRRFTDMQREGKESIRFFWVRFWTTLSNMENTRRNYRTKCYFASIEEAKDSIRSKNRSPHAIR